MANIDPGQCIELLNSMKERHGDTFNAKPGRVLAFVGTTSAPDACAQVFPRRIVEIGGSEKEVQLTLQGVLPAELKAGERVTASLVDLATYQGYQLKTRELGPYEDSSALIQRGDGRTTITCRFVYTVHHSPNTKTFFERVPGATIAREMKGVRAAMVGVGVGVNISPRFVFHFETTDALHLYWGEGHMNKTAANFSKNRCLAVAIVDLRTHAGIVLRGQGRPLEAQENPAAQAQVQRGFDSGSWGVPSSVVDFVAKGMEGVGV